jgi:hypothetical protein
MLKWMAIGRRRDVGGGNETAQGEIWTGSVHVFFSRLQHNSRLVPVKGVCSKGDEHPRKINFLSSPIPTMVQATNSTRVCHFTV